MGRKKGGLDTEFQLFSIVSIPISMCFQIIIFFFPVFFFSIQSNTLNAMKKTGTCSFYFRDVLSVTSFYSLFPSTEERLKYIHG